MQNTHLLWDSREEESISSTAALGLFTAFFALVFGKAYLSRHRRKAES